MPHFTVAVTASGPVIDLLVGVSSARAQALQAAGQAIPNPVNVRALVDTGASCTCIDPSALSTLGLSPKGVTPVFTPSTGATPHFASAYDVSLIIPCPGMLPLFMSNIPITESVLDNQGIKALLGRDVLNRCMLIYNGHSGFLTLAY